MLNFSRMFLLTFAKPVLVAVYLSNVKFKIMSWNHRILAHENNGEVYFQLHEVYYKNEVPDGYTETILQ